MAEEKNILDLIDEFPAENSYAIFCREYLDAIFEHDEVYRLEELPLKLRHRLNIVNEGLGNGVVISKNSFSFWISCNVSQEEEDFLSFSSLAEIIKEFHKIKEENEKLKDFIIVTTALEVDDEFFEMEDVKIYTIEDQEPQAEKIFKRMNKTTRQTFVLYPHQKEDLAKIMAQLSSKGSRQLFDAYCGYGKTNIFIELAIQFHKMPKNKNEIIIMAFPLLNIQNQTVERFYRHIKGIKNYDPLMLCFSSASAMGIYNTSDSNSVIEFVSERGPKIIFTTYKSLHRLLCSLDEYNLPLVILDEAHNFKAFRWFNQRPETNYIAFTATPLQETRKHFESVVSRSLAWSIEKQLSCDFEFVPYGIKNLKSPEKILIDLFEKRLVSKLLIISSSVEKITAYKEIFDLYNGIVAHVVTATDSQEQRRKKEREVEAAEFGVLLSVKIYREGIDFPWMEGLYLDVGSIQQHQMVQTALRVTRNSVMKRGAKIFIPYDYKEGKEFYQNPKFELICLFVSYIAKNAEASEKKKVYEWYGKRISAIVIDQREDKLYINSEEENGTSLVTLEAQAEILSARQLDCFIYGITWLMVVSCAIISLFDQEEFSLSDLLFYADNLAYYKKAKTNSPEKEIMKALKKLSAAGLCVVDKDSDTCYFDYEKLNQMVRIPFDFPV